MALTDDEITKIADQCGMYECHDNGRINGNMVLDFARAVLAAAPAQAEPSAPEGWKLVPVQPTQEMCQVAQWKLREWPRYPFRVAPVYQAMLDAAPPRS